MDETREEETAAQSVEEELGDQIYTHIASQSTTRLGVCLTLVGLFKVVDGLKTIEVLADEILAVGAVAFLVSGMLGYYALRTKKPRTKYLVGRIADATYLASNGLLIVICLIIAFELL